MTHFRLRRLLALAIVFILTAQSAGFVLATPAQQDTQQPVTLSSCETPRPVVGVDLNYNTNIELESELLQGLLTQANTYVRRGTASASSGDYAQARRFYTYAVDYLLIRMFVG